LVDLADQGGIVPRLQELPCSAKITTENIWQCRWGGPSRSVLVISYPWLDRFHPDREGVQLRRIAPVLQAMLNSAQTPQTGPRTKRPHATVGVMLDYTCLPQHPRTEVEAELFAAALNQMHLWYSHPFTATLMCTLSLPPPPLNAADYSNRREYLARGWCRVEMRQTNLVKGFDCVWDLRHFTGGAKSRWQTACKKMAQLNNRSPPVSPHALAKELREGVESGSLFFSYAADLEEVVEMYRRGFISAFENFGTTRVDKEGHIDFSELGWGDDEAYVLADAFAYVEKHCDFAVQIPVRLGGNTFTAKGRGVLEVAVGRKLKLHFDTSTQKKKKKKKK
jgi:hypothetical protein